MLKTKTPLTRGRFLPQRNVTILPNFQTDQFSLRLRANILYEPRAVLLDGQKFYQTIQKRLKKVVTITKEESNSIIVTGVGLIATIVSPMGSAYQTTTNYAVTQSKLREEAVTSQVQSKVESNESAEFTWPVNGSISQNYTMKHKALDVRAGFNTPVKSVAKGIVESAFVDIYGLGRAIIVKHIDGTKSLYAHLNKVEVKEGQDVTQDTEIGTVGLTGRTTGAHLHFEIEDHGKKINPTGVLPEKAQ